MGKLVRPVQAQGSGARVSAARTTGRPAASNGCLKVKACGVGPARSSSAMRSSPSSTLGSVPAGSHHSAMKAPDGRSEEHTSELQSLMRHSYAVFCLKKKSELNQKVKMNKKIHRQSTNWTHEYQYAMNTHQTAQLMWL